MRLPNGTIDLYCLIYSALVTMLMLKNVRVMFDEGLECAEGAPVGKLLLCFLLAASPLGAVIFFFRLPADCVISRHSQRAGGAAKNKRRGRGLLLITFLCL
uniref:Uncharacterized protein n=1 Tax=Trypanosoma congolense (strain IL3000) TaxID=1068625 RepID=G0UL49_TRYCI|nr:hypothetical protein, unlikely [Trypanosoma congolense IL3000]